MIIEYKCIKEFSVDLLDDDCKYTGKTKKITVGSRWQRAGYNLGDGEVHLEKYAVRKGNLTGHWIEIPKERLNECFEEL